MRLEFEADGISTTWQWERMVDHYFLVVEFV